jgi:predicted amidophosphoribosyltransferase
MHPRKLRRRGYNQARLLAEGVAAVLQIPVVHAIQKKVDTGSQTRLGRTARWRNVQAAFARSAKPADVAGTRILLVDDVLTTGATLEGAAQPLLKAGVSQIGIAVLASVV